MKPYVILCAVCYALLLLIPLPLLPSGSGDTAGTAADAGTDKPTSTTAPATAEKETFTVLDTSAGVLYTFAQRDFLIYTVAAEMPASYHAEALKAQAVAAYTYYSYEKLLNADSKTLQGADSSRLPASFPATYSPEGLRTLWGDSYDTHLKAVAAAVDAVLGEQILYENKPILAAYHHRNWGRTETAGVVWGTDQPYLQSVVSSGDLADANGISTVTVSDKEFAAAFDGLSLTGDAGSWIGGEPVCSPAGSVTSLTVGGKAFTGTEVREAFSLRSACFTVSHGENGFTFQVKGDGHGVGLSQCGADAMAQQGFSYKEILQHYYTGVTIE
ncbi:MAG: SpoIID/LytB domain-containing protein [Clostridia bacterium]|nr:SpoIID/LytB domain-containing protein [Clostridia bacterium]